MGDYYVSDAPSTVNLADQINQHLSPVQPVQPVQPIQTQYNPNVLTSQQLAQIQNNPMYHYNDSRFTFDFQEILKRAIKYLIEGLAVAFVAYYFIGKGKLNIKDIVMLGITAACVFAILDVFSPTVALGARFGAGFGIGTSLFGLNPAVIGGPSLVAPIL